MNLLPEVSTGAVVTREGYKRMPNFGLAGYKVTSMHPYNVRSTGDKYLILVATNESVGTQDNVVVYAYNLKTQTSSKISPLKTWTGVNGRHYGFVVDDTFYGGGEQDPMYSWKAVGSVWTDNASAYTYPTLITTGSPVGGQVHINKAFKKGDGVVYSSKKYSAVRDIRFDDWVSNNQTYTPGDKVSHKGNWSYYRSFKCVKKHTTLGSGTSEPGVGSVWKDYWKPVKLELPINADNEESEDWDQIPEAPKTSVANFHANRMWARDDAVNSEQAIFSRLPKLVKTDAVWDPKDWRVTDVDGAGWEHFKSDDGDPITGFQDFGYYQIVFKRHNTFVVAGTVPGQWQIRPIADVGCVNARASTQHEGKVYFLSDRGFYVTNGVDVEEVLGADRMRTWFRKAINWAEDPSVVMWSFGGYVWISLPTGKGKNPDRTIVYDPRTQSFWKLDFGVQCVVVARAGGVEQMYFSLPSQIGSFSAFTYSWSGVAHRSSSTRSDGAVNLFKNPSFEPAGYYNDPEAWKTSSGWATTHTKCDYIITTAAARRGTVGAEVTNKGTDAIYRGITESFSDASGAAHVISARVRRPRWLKNSTKPDVRLYAGAELASGAHNWVELGRGWWQVWATYTGSVISSAHGIVVGPASSGNTVQVDQLHCHPGTTPLPYFDGEGGEDTAGDTIGGGTGLVMQYAHPDSNYTDDLGQTTYTTKPIQWRMQTAWFPFGVLKEERWVRRTWALIRGNGVTVALRGLKNFRPDPVYLKVQTSDLTSPVNHFEGRAREMGVAHSVGFRIEGAQAPAAVLGVAVDTKFRRVRYGT